MAEKPFYDRSVFWTTFGGAVVAVGAVPVGVGLVRMNRNVAAGLWSDHWFELGMAIVGAGALSLWWSLTLYLAHRHSEQHFEASRPSAQEPRSPRPFSASPSPGTVRLGGGPTKLRAELDENLKAIREFYGEFEKIAGPRPAQPSEEDAVMLDLSRLASQRLADIPLREYEFRIVLHILRDATGSLSDIPFLSMQPGNDATDVQFTGRRRQCAEPDGGEQMWQISTIYKAYGEGLLRSDQTLETLTDLHRRVMHLRQEVYDRYHPPAAPAQ